MDNTALTLFEKDGWKIRTVLIDGEPWFVGKDVAEALGYTNPQKAIRDHVDEDDKKRVNESFTVNGTMAILINESGVYSLILRSNLPKAKEFKRWVTSVILPSIRKTGSYSAQKEQDNKERVEIDVLFKDPRYMIKLLNAYADEKDAREEAERQLAEAAPKVDAFDRLMEKNPTYNMTETAHLIQSGLSVQKLNKLLIDTGICYREGKGRNCSGIVLPHQKYIEEGWFVVKESHDSLTGTPYRQMRSTFKGRTELIQKFKYLFDDANKIALFKSGSLSEK